jgi:integrase/recombinase XerC
VALTSVETMHLRSVVTESVTRFSTRDRLIFEVLLGTGIRLGSLVGLNVRDVDLQSGTLTIQSKGGGEERVFLNPRLVRMLAAYINESRTQGDCGANTPLFRSRSGRRLGARAIQLKFTKWVQDAGIERPVTVHSLRHTFATRLYEKTGDLYLVQRALGHRNITTTEIYAKVSDERLRWAVSAATSL